MESIQNISAEKSTFFLFVGVLGCGILFFGKFFFARHVFGVFHFFLLHLIKGE